VGEDNNAASEIPGKNKRVQQRDEDTKRRGESGSSKIQTDRNRRFRINTNQTNENGGKTKARLKRQPKKKRFGHRDSEKKGDWRLQTLQKQKRVRNIMPRVWGCRKNRGS